MQRLGQIVVGLLVVCAWGVLAFAVVALAGRFLGDRFPIFDLAVQFLGVAFWAALVATILFALDRQWGASVAMIVVAVVALAVIWPRSDFKPCEGAEVRRIVFHNVLDWSPWHGKTVKYLVGAGADIIVLTEMWSGLSAPYDQLLQDYPYELHCAPLSCDIVIFSKFPLINVTSAELHEANSTRAIAVAVALPEARLNLFTAHLMPLPWPGASLRRQRARADALAAEFNALPAPSLFVGDFNAVPWGRNMRKIIKQSNAYMLPSWGTWPAFLPSLFGFPIDHALVGQGIVCATKAIGPRTGSDHYPIIVEFGF